MSIKFPKSHVLLLGTDSVHTLLPSTLITRADALLERHRIEDAVELAEQQLKRLQGRPSVDGANTDELRYVFQRIGFQCLTETLFDDAGRHLFSGELDPRVLISYYPDLRGSLFSEEDKVDVFAGVAECMPPEASMDDIIAINLVRNYSPHLAPNTSTAPPTVELRNILNIAATDMLKVFLRKWRAKKWKDGEGRVHEVVDTVLCKLYTTLNETTDLLALIDSPNDIVLTEIEPVLAAAGRYDALCRLYTARGQETKLLNIWSRLVSGEIMDEDVPDPLGNMFTYLQDKRDRVLAQEWGVWLIKWDPDRALKLLTTVGSNKRSAKVSATATDDVTLLNQIQATDPMAGIQYLEYLVFNRRSLSAELHTQLASTYILQVIDCLDNDGTMKLWRAKVASFCSSSVAAGRPFTRSSPSAYHDNLSSSSSPQPRQSQLQSSFLTYFASTTPESPSKTIRLKTMLFLQSSKLYDATHVWNFLDGACDGDERCKVLALERATLLGKLGRHQEALTTLIYTLHDGTSAETYCASGGQRIVPLKTLQAMAERYGIGMISSTKDKDSGEETEEQLKRKLTSVLLEVYMSDGAVMAEPAAKLLDAQGVNLDVLEVLPLIPPSWPLHTLTPFLTRSIRRTLHTRHEAQLVKAIAASESLAVVESTWGPLREGGMIVEEALNYNVDDGEFNDDERYQQSEKVGLLTDDGEGLEFSEKTHLDDHSQERVRGYNVDGEEEDVDSVL